MHFDKLVSVLIHAMKGDWSCQGRSKQIVYSTEFNLPNQGPLCIGRKPCGEVKILLAVRLLLLAGHPVPHPKSLYKVPNMKTIWLRNVESKSVNWDGIVFVFAKVLPHPA